MVFSPSGAILTAGTTSLLQIDATAVPVSVQATSPLAMPVDAAVLATHTTGISETALPTLQISGARNGLQLTASTACGPLVVCVYDTQGRLLTSHEIEQLPAGKTHLPMTVMPTDGIVIVKMNGEDIGTNIYKLQIAK